MQTRLLGYRYFYDDLAYAEAATQEAPPATTGAPPAETKPEGQGTAGGTPVAQPENGGSAAPATPADSTQDPPAAPSPTDAAIAAARRADAARMATRLGLEGDYDSVEDVEAALATAEEEAHEAELDAQANNAYGNRVRQLITNLQGVKFQGYNEQGEVVNFTLTPDQIQTLAVSELNGLRGDVRAIEQRESFMVLADAALALIPEDKHADFEKAVSKGLPIGEWFKHAVEHAAPTSAYVKQLQKEHEAAVAKAHADGFAEGAGAPKGQFSQSGGSGRPAPSLTGKTVAEQAALLESGEVSFAEEYRQLLAQS